MSKEMSGRFKTATGLSDAASESDSEDERRERPKKAKKKSKKHKKDKKRKKHKKRRHHSSASSSESVSDEWVEKSYRSEASDGKTAPVEPSQPKREDWMNSMLIPTYSREPRKDEKPSAAKEQYDPKTSVRELNPYWKDGGSGLPAFKKPSEDDEPDDRRNTVDDRQNYRKRRSTGWQQSTSSAPEERVKPAAATPLKSDHDEMFLSDEQLNDLGAKIMKAELLGNTTLMKTLKDKLEKAKAYRLEIKDRKQRLEVDDADHLEYTVSKARAQEAAKLAQRQKRIQQHLPAGNLTDKFCSERSANDNMDAQFFKASSKMDRAGDNLENIFDHQRASTTATGGHSTEEDAVRAMNKLAKVQADCDKCISSRVFSKDRVISVGKKVYLAVPYWKALQPMHCWIVPVDHYSALTQVDEDVHEEIVTVCKALVQMFASHSMEVVFFESVRYLNRSPHMYIECVPSTNYEYAPMCFAKAIQDSETEWAMNKKMHNMEGLAVRRVVPKELPYFWVSFDLGRGFVHVIEDQEKFPATFAAETLAGLLELDTKAWRLPHKEQYPERKVREFQQWWKAFDVLKTNIK